MPNVGVIDLNPRPAPETTLEKTIAGFTKGYSEAKKDREERDALKSIYKQYQDDAINIDNAIMEVNTRKGISPSTRVRTAEQLMEFKKYNKEITDKAKIEADAAADIQAIEDVRKLPRGSLKGFKNPQLAASVSKPEKLTQSEKSMEPSQLAIIEKVRSDPNFQKADPYQKYQMLTSAGVSSPNAKNESEIAAKNISPYETESDKIDAKRTGDYINSVAEKGKSADIKLRGINEGMELLKQGATGFKIGNYLADYFDVPALRDPKSSAFNAAMKSQYTGIGDIVKGKVSNFEFQTFQGMIADAENNPKAAELLLVSAKMEAMINQKEREIVDAKRMDYYNKGEKMPPNFDIQVRKELQPYADLIMHQTNEEMRNIISPTQKGNPNNQRLQEIFLKKEQ